MSLLFKKLSNILSKTKKTPSISSPVGKTVSGSPPVKTVLPDQKTRQIISEAQNKARELIIEAKDEIIRMKTISHQESERFKEELERKIGVVAEKEQQVELKKKDLENILIETEEIKKEQLLKLERVADLNRDQAKTLILNTWEEKLTAEIAKKIRDAQSKAKEEAEKRSRDILVEAMKHGAIDYVAEYTVSTVKIKDEEMKGRIIGKEGRNIRTFEQVTGVDVDLDEEGVIRLSSFDPIRREIARVGLEKLMADGRIQPVRIEEIIEHTKKDIDRIMFVEGEKLAHSVGVYNLPVDIIAMLGRFKYRFSYGQNMITHTLEETKIGVAIANEIKADTNIVRLGCLLHDIGKVITDEEGTHVQLGVNLLKKYNMPQSVIDCVAQHHEDTPFTSVESMIIYISDAISGARPGARYEDYEEYIKRLTDLEDIAKAHKGVKNTYAYQAGRELRVFVEPDELDDAACELLAHQISEEIEKRLTYAGNINVTVIRESRYTGIAK